MSAKTKIWVMHMRELVFTAVFTVLGILLLLFIAVSLSHSGKDTTTTRSDASSATETTPLPPDSGYDITTPSSVARTDISTPSSAATGSEQILNDLIEQENTSASSPATVPVEKYLPGIYRTVLYLNDQTVDIEVTVDPYQITSLSLVNVDANIQTMYPLLSTTFEDIKTQLYRTQAPELVTYDSEKKYTSLVLLEAISKALEKAALP